MTIEQTIILSAGKGSRLYPYTESRPKCLLELSGRSLLEWQLDALFDIGMRKTIIVTGYRNDLVEAVVSERQETRGEIELIFNPFFQVADNLGSVWMARHHWHRDTLLLNGDTLVSTELLTAVLGNAPPTGNAITVTIDRKAEYDADDMKVLCNGSRLERIGKELSEYNGESIGLVAFRGSARKEFVDAVEAVMATPEGVRVWYLRVVDQLALRGLDDIVTIEGSEWQEVDYLADVDAARVLTAKWAAEGR